MAREMIVVPYDEKWPELYETEKEVLVRIFGEHTLAIRHFGSTSIKGMSAKPVIDIMITVDDIGSVDNYNEIMTEIGYVPRGENGIPGRRYFVRFGPDGENHTHHVHIYEPDHRNVSDEMLFRDFLAVDEESFKQYENVKLAASEKYRCSPLEYTEAKSDCVKEIMKKAKLMFTRR